MAWQSLTWRQGLKRSTARSSVLHDLGLAVLLALLPTTAEADFPDRTVKIVVPFDAGGTVDAVARALANRLNAKWSVPVIVENRPGAGNTIGANAVAKAEPDGHTLLFANTSVSVNPSLFKSLPYDTLRDLAPVVYLSPSPNVLLVQKTLGIESVKEFVALAKARAASPLSFASVGKGSAHHFCMELLKSEAGIDLLHVPYRGVAPAVLAVTRGEVDLYCSDIPGAINLLNAGKVTALGITSRKRSTALPDVPPLAEQGLPNYAATGYVGIMVTGGTPPEIVQRLNASINEIVREPEFAGHFSAFGYEMLGGSSEEFASFLKDDIERYRQLTRATGIAPE
jgi:tripartite-type tricarboxylate transporter receptor subunit TctC